MADKPKDHVYVEEGELKKVRDPRTGQIKEVDLSLAALSRTMENIRKSADIINQPDVSITMAMGRFDYIKDLVLDSAQFSPKLQNLQIKILNKYIEVVRNLEELDDAKILFAKRYYMQEAKNILAKTDKRSGSQRVDSLHKALDILVKGKQYVGENDEEYNQYIDLLKKELTGHRK